MPTKTEVRRVNPRRGVASLLLDDGRFVGAEEGSTIDLSQGWSPNCGFLLILEEPEDEPKFWKPIPLPGVPSLVRNQMYEVAPMLRGRHAWYLDKFFSTVVGLCNLGCEVDRALAETNATEEEVLRNWKPTTRDKHRFPIAHCTDPKQASLFARHFSRVYGGRPDNEAFSMRFLIACFATFVHKQDVNWAVEAAKHRQAQVERSKHNPGKLGPLAIREQVRGLCAVIERYARASGDNWEFVNGTNAELAAIPKMQSCSNEHLLIYDAYTEASQRIEKLKDTFAILCAEEEPLIEEWGAAISTSKLLKQQGRNAEADDKKELARSLLCKMKDHSDKQQAVELELKKATYEDLPGIEQSLKEAMDDFLAAKDKLNMTRLENFHLRPMLAFSQWPAQHSIPRMLHLQSQLCSACNFGFVSRSSIFACCGCIFHPSCFACLLQEGNLNCPQCGCEFDGGMLAQ